MCRETAIPAFESIQGEASALRRAKAPQPPGIDPPPARGPSALPRRDRQGDPLCIQIGMGQPSIARAVAAASPRTVSSKAAVASRSAGGAETWPWRSRGNPLRRSWALSVALRGRVEKAAEPKEPAPHRPPRPPVSTKLRLVARRGAPDSQDPTGHLRREAPPSSDAADGRAIACRRLQLPNGS